MFRNRMKKHLILISFFILIFGDMSTVYSSNWFLICVHSETRDNWYLDDETIKFNNNIVKAWVKTEYTKEGVLDLSKRIKNDYLKHHNLSYTLSLNDSDINNQQLRVIEILDYNTNGGLISRFDNSKDSQWSNIVPESVYDSIYKYIIKKYKK